MTIYNVMKVFHVIAAIVFAGGLFARQVVRGYARKTDDINVLGIIQARLGGIPIFGILSGSSQNWLFVSNCAPP